MKHARFCRFLTAFVCLSLSQAARAEKIQVGYSAISGSMLTPWAALEAGIFRKNGLDVDLIYIAGGTTAAAALLGGDVQVILATGDVVVRGRLQGADLVSFADATSTLVFSLIARPEILRPEDLKGKRLGVSRFGTATHAALLAALNHFRISPTEVTILQMGGLPQIMAGIETGGIAAGVLSPPTNIRAIKVGMKELLDIGTLNIPYQQSTFTARASWIRKSPEIMRKLTRSIVEAIHRIKTDRPMAQKVLAKYTKIEDPWVVEEAYRIFALNYLPEIPYPSERAVQQRLDELAPKDEKARAANPKDFIDANWIRELESSGFIARLYKR